MGLSNVMVRLIFLSFTALISLAQSPTASMSGTVQDSQGAVIMGAKVTAINLRTQIRSEARSELSGLFTLRQLPIGEYVVEVELEGFRKYIRKGIVLSTGENVELTPRLNWARSPRASRLDLGVAAGNTPRLHYRWKPRRRKSALGDQRSLNLTDDRRGCVVGYDSGSKPNFKLAGRTKANSDRRRYRQSLGPGGCRSAGGRHRGKVSPTASAEFGVRPSNIVPPRR
jgi:hypothetical protein